ncbi:MAG: universal stress protein [Armatimonadetes bacterium]|nr:universal stress protein [Armatimonadota bacterium]
MYKRILVALDHSRVDDATLEHISRLARELGSTLILYRVAHYHTRDSKAHEMEEAEAYLAKIRARMAQEGLDCETAIGQGEPGHAIAEDAEKLNCDLIVIGTHGHSSLMRWVMGSVAEDVKRLTHIPLLLVKAPRPVSD